jgi:hypothetical protein
LVIYKEKQGILGSQLNALADKKVELTHGQIVGHQILALVKVRNAGLGRFFNNDLYTVKWQKVEKFSGQMPSSGDLKCFSIALVN